MQQQGNPQADKAFKKGKKALKTGVFKWKPDYLEAVSCFEDAAKLYRTSMKWKEALDAYDQLCECQKQISDAWGVARALEGQLQIYLEHKEFITSDDLLLNKYREAAHFFKTEDTIQNVTKLSLKVSEYFASKQNIDLSVQVVKEAYDGAVASEKPYNVSGILNQYIDILVKNQKYIEAIGVYTEQINNLKSKNTSVPLENYVLAIVCLFLIQKDSIGASNVMDEILMDLPTLNKHIEVGSARRLIDAYDVGNQSGFTDMAGRPPVNLLHPVIITRLIKKLQVPVSAVDEPVQQQQQGDNVDAEQQMKDLVL